MSFLSQKGPGSLLLSVTKQSVPVTSTLAPAWARPTPMLHKPSATTQRHVARPVQTVPAQAVLAGATPAPSGRRGYVSDVVGVAAWLASSASDFVNGQVIYIDGGMTAVLR